MIVVPLVAIIPFIVGAIWYNPKIAGTAWMQAADMTEEKIQQGNMLVIFGVGYLLSCFLCFSMLGMVNHQMGALQLFFGAEGFGQEGTPIQNLYEEFVALLGDKHQTAGHGAFHGFFYSIVVALPIIGINALFEQRSAKYIFIHLGYWALTLTAIGAVMGQYGFK